MDFGQPNVEIGRKMAIGRLLFLALKSGEILSLTLLLCGLDISTISLNFTGV